jgi:hypothetical protein
MKKVTILFLLTLCLASAHAQVPSDCTVPSQLSLTYERDIKNMAIRRMYEVQHADTSFIAIPATQFDSVAEGLAAILNAVSIPQRDSIFNMYCVHDNSTSMQTYHGLLVQVDTTFAWTQAWQNLISFTGDPLMDALVQNYHLAVAQFYNWSFGNYALLHTDSLWNIYALIDSLESIAGVIYAEPDAVFGAAGKILYSVSGSGRYYDFYFEFNDCFDGCDNYRDWKYKVNPDCSVEYLGFEDWGVFGISPLPAPLNCNVFTSVIENSSLVNCRIFPNPSNDKLTISWNKSLNRPHDVVLFDMGGREVKRILNIHSAELKMDISRLPAASYVLKLYEDEKVISSGKIMKE